MSEYKLQRWPSTKRKLKVARAVLLNDGPAYFLRRIWASSQSLWCRGETIDECEIVWSESASHGMMIDIGAHTGSALHRFANAGWHVIAFEPDPRNRAILTRLYEGHSNVVIDARGVWDKVQEEVPFYVSGKSTGISSLARFDETHRQGETIATTTLSRILQEYRIGKVDVLKIDTEGTDLFVLHGLPEEVRPGVILCEFEDRKTLGLGYSHADLAAELVRRGYHVIMSEWYPIESYGRRHRWRRAVYWPAQPLDEGAWGNFVAAADSDLAERIFRAFPMSAG